MGLSTTSSTTRWKEVLVADVEITKLLVAIVDRGKSAALVEVYRECRLPLEYICMGRGTANSRILDYLGLSETQKDIVVAFVPARRVTDVMRAVDERFDLSSPGRGVLFSCPLSGVSAQVPQLLSDGIPPQKEETYVESSQSFDLVTVIVNRGDIDLVMDAARSAGARGGTVVHGRRMGVDDAETRRGFVLEPEKDIVLMVVAHEQKLDVMRAVNKAAGITTPSRGVLFSLPVEEVMGLRPVVEEGPDDSASAQPSDGAAGEA